jgi:serine protease AprX
MNKTSLIILIILIFKATCIFSQEYYWIGFTDKNNSPYKLNSPENYLSERAIQRRINQNIPIDSLDLPVNPDYISQVLSTGVSLLHSSKWLNGITIKAEADSFKSAVMAFPFVSEIQLTKPAIENKSASLKFDRPNAWSDNLPIDTTLYGPSVYQTGLLNGQFLHEKDKKGQGMHIAVLDAGFFKANNYTAFDSLWANNQILGTRDFVNPDSDIYAENYHGMSVLSCMGGNIPGSLIGTAPKASYWLIRSEKVASEYIYEEDNWVAAAEFADSVGVDIINSSLGYFVFQDSVTNHSYADMDGKTTRITRAANIAFTRGILVFCSAGNEGDKKWKYIIAPADGDNVIAVGAVNKFGFPSDFTSRGPAFDGDIKPNLAAVGWNTYLQKSNGTLGYSSGTSFASPVLAGMAACLWQANPNATAADIKYALEKSGHLYDIPDTLLGYGVPDMKIAHLLLNPDASSEFQKISDWKVYPNPVQNSLYIQRLNPNYSDNVVITLYSIDGRILLKEQRSATSQIILNNLQTLPSGLLILKLESGNHSETFKINKSR